MVLQPNVLATSRSLSNYEFHAQALLLDGFGFIIRYINRPFFTVGITLLVMGLGGPDIIFSIFPQDLAYLRRVVLFRSSVDPHRAPASHGHPA